MDKLINFFIDTKKFEVRTKNVIIVLLFIAVVGLMYITSHQKTRLNNARSYIHELEEQVGDNLMDTVGSGDAYDNYYHY